MKTNIETHINERCREHKGHNDRCTEGRKLLFTIEGRISRKKLASQELDFNNIDRYQKRNNMKIKGISSSISDEDLENKVIGNLNITVVKKDIKAFHRLGKDSKNTILRFFN